MGNGTEAVKDRLKRVAGAPYARAAVVALLAAAALGQAVAQAVALSSPAGGPGRPAGFPTVLAAEYVLPLSLLALLATVPLAVYRPAMAAVAVTFGNAVALASFGPLTAGGVIAELAAACWLGLAGGLDGAAASRALGRLAGSGAMAGRCLAAGLGLPFLVMALAGSGRAAVLLAAAVPVAAGAGILAWAGRLARTRTAAGEALADTLLAHTARGERARIARELHDVVAHHISMIAVLSETGRLTTPGLPEAGARRFAEIGDTARSGLTEMRRLLGVLREDAGQAEDAVAAEDAAAAALPAPSRAAARRASRHPQPGLAQLTELIDAARDASVAGTRLIISGPVAALDPGVELAAYRIVQEALTNARRHAPGAAVDVELRYSPAALRLRVRDNGPGPAGTPASGDGVAARDSVRDSVRDTLRDNAHDRVSDSAGPDAMSGLMPASRRTADGGHGLPGMRERAFSVGGSLYAGMAPGGGFLVEAVLPADAGPAGLLPAAAGSSGLAAGAGR
jgi:signal transduction histidine kinase